MCSCLNERCCSIRWSQKHRRSLFPTEMLAIMGLPISKKLADYCSSRVANVSMLSAASKALGECSQRFLYKGWLTSTIPFHRLVLAKPVVFHVGTHGQVKVAGNGMCVCCVGFILFCVNLADLNIFCMGSLFCNLS